MRFRYTVDILEQTQSSGFLSLQTRHRNKNKKWGMGGVRNDRSLDIQRLMKVGEKRSSRNLHIDYHI